jgi:TolB protein
MKNKYTFSFASMVGQTILSASSGDCQSPAEIPGTDSPVHWQAGQPALRFWLFLMLAFCILVTAASIAPAQQEISIDVTVDVVGGVKPVPITLNGFSGEAASVLKFDLEVQGFKVVSDESAQFDVTGASNGEVKGALTDRINKAQLFAKVYTGGNMRAQAHALADDIVQAIMKRKGIGSTKIAFKVDTGGSSEIYVADFDGHNARQVTKDNSLVAAPCLVPGRLALYYVSYKLGGAYIFHHDLSTGARSAFARYGGSNISPAVSPDGGQVAMILSKDGWTDLYVSNADGTGLRRLTKSPQDESSPCWSPDGRWILFAGKVGERRQLWKVSPEGGEPVRVPTSGVSNPSEPDWSPDGKWIVFTAMMGGFEICVVPAGGGTATALVGGEDPSWGPNSRTVIFARRSGNGRILSVLDVFTKQVKDVQRISGGNSQPSWAK